MKEAIANLNIMAKATNYNKYLFDKIKPYLGEKILEVGCGTGNITRLLLQHQNVKLVIGIDTSSECLDAVNHGLAGCGQFRSLLCDISSEEVLLLRKYNFDTVVCMNVLEHIKDDCKALRNMAELAENLILLVPAIEKLYGTIDKADGHFRRYDKIELEKKLSQSGWIIRENSYINLLGIPVWMLHGKILRKTIHPSEQLSFLDKFVYLETLLERFFNLSIGLSMLYVCRRK